MHPHRHRDLVDEARLHWCTKALAEEYARYPQSVARAYREAFSRCRGDWTLDGVYDDIGAELRRCASITEGLVVFPVDRERLLCALTTLVPLAAETSVTLLDGWAGISEWVDGRFPATWEVTDALRETKINRQRFFDLVRSDVIEVPTDCVAAFSGIVPERSALVFCPACGVPHVIPGMAPGPERVAGHQLPVSRWPVCDRCCLR